MPGEEDILSPVAKTPAALSPPHDDPSADRALGRCRAGEGACRAVRTPPAALVCVSSLAPDEPFSQDVTEVLRQRSGDRHLEEPAGLRVDDNGAVRGQEGPNLLLGAAGELLKKEVADNPDVKEQLGDIESISMNFMETGQEKQKRNDNSNWIVFDAKGSEGDGKFIAEMPPGGSNGSPFGKIELRTEDGKTIQIK